MRRRYIPRALDPVLRKAPKAIALPLSELRRPEARASVFWRTRSGRWLSSLDAFRTMAACPPPAARAAFRRIQRLRRRDLRG